MSSTSHLPQLNESDSYEDIYNTIVDALSVGDCFYSPLDFDSVINKLAEANINQGGSHTLSVYQSVPGSTLYQEYATSQVFIIIEKT